MPVFVAVLKLFCLGRTSTQTTRVIVRWARRFSPQLRRLGKTEVSRNSVQKHFSALGARAYQRHIDTMTHVCGNRDSAIRILDYFVSTYWALIKGDFDYTWERDVQYKEDLVVRVMKENPHLRGFYISNSPHVLEILSILRQRMLEMRGLNCSESQFKGHVGYAYMIFRNKGEQTFDGKIPASWQLRQIQLKATIEFIWMLQDNPLDLRLGQSIDNR